MSNVLLVGKYSVIEPLGLMYLVSSLKKDGHTSDILLVNDDKAIIKEDGYDFIGFSVYTGFHLQMYQLSLGLNYNTKVIMGGSHSTFFHDDCRKYSHYVVVGEGMKSILDICNGKGEEGIVFNPNLMKMEDIPLPDREVLYNYDERFKYNKIKNVMTSFGCPYSCHYCYNISYRKLYPNVKIRQRSVESVIEECEKIKKDYSTELIYFQDDCFGHDMKWLEEFTKKYNENVCIPFHCQVRPEMINNNRLQLFAEAGCLGITVAIETFNEKVRSERLNRHMSNTSIIDACIMVKEYGFKLRTEQMLGLPETIIEDELALLKMNVDIGPEMAWSSIFVPYLGTELGDWCKENKMYNGNNDDLSESFFSDTVLNFDPERKKNTNLLHKIFIICARLPHGDILAENCLNNNIKSLDELYKEVKKHIFDYDLYNIK